MNIKRIATIALSNRDYAGFEEKLREACRWVSMAARMGCDLAALPEALNIYAGDGPNNPNAMSLSDSALDDWQKECRTLVECAAEHRIAVTVPVILREGAGLRNVFFLVAKDGGVLGRYEKRHPTPCELSEGVIPGNAEPIVWERLKVGGAICFDMNFEDVFREQKRNGVELFLCPSLCPGGDQVNHYAASFQCPIVIAYPAWSRIIGALGHELVQGGYRHETLRFGFGVPVYVADVNFDFGVFHFDHNQEKIEDILRCYGKDVWLTFDQDNVRFSLESRSPDLTISEIVERFELKPLAAYLQNS